MSNESRKIHKSETKTKLKSKKYNKSSSSSNSDDEWVEKPEVLVTSKPKQLFPTDTNKELERESWMKDSNALSMKTFSYEWTKSKKSNEKLQQINSYDPVRSKLELNSYWKTTGTGLPFQRPKNSDVCIIGNDQQPVKKLNSNQPTSYQNWQKKLPNNNIAERNKLPIKSYTSALPEISKKQVQMKPNKFLIDHDLNQLAAKAMKAELKGNKELAAKLYGKLENARIFCTPSKSFNDVNKDKSKGSEDAVAYNNEKHVLLTYMDERGNVRPLAQTCTLLSSIESRDDRKGRKGNKKESVETHVNGKRVRYFADDDHYDMKQILHREKFTSAADVNLQFAEFVSEHKNHKDELENIFVDSVRHKTSQTLSNKRELQRGVSEQQKLDVQLKNCEFCFDSDKLDKHQIISVGEKIYLALPCHVGLQFGHCILTPMQHISCSTQLDEDAWDELQHFCRSLTQMFKAQNKDVLFYEIAYKLHRWSHLAIHCIPIPDSKAEMLPFYFKKAIEESEHEWSVNKQLISLHYKSLRNSIPKGLPYFWVNFGMNSGFAHVIEDEDRFPMNFAQEIIGGMLDLNASSWRRPQKEQNIKTKVKLFTDSWSKYDFTKH